MLGREKRKQSWGWVERVEYCVLGRVEGWETGLGPRVMNPVDAVGWWYIE